MKVHFIALAGSVMHNLAITLHNKGFYVSGSDDVFYEPSRSRLATVGLLPEKEGWFPQKITSDLNAVILGMHAHKDNPELLEAKRLGLKIYSYPSFIYEQIQNKTRVVIGGSHGKTTITSMILHVMHHHEKAIDYMVGAKIEGFENMIHLSSENEFVVLEGDEYPTSALDLRPKFHLYKPNIALISGIAWDHINVFKTFEDYLKQFDIFIDQIVQGGMLIYNEEDPYLNNLVQSSKHIVKKLAYKTPSYKEKQGKTYIETQWGSLGLHIFGHHNLLNLEGARLVCNQMGIMDEAFYEAIASFKGASLRLERLKDTSQYIVYKDFAHSPSKVNASLKAVKSHYPDRKIFVALELHTYSSLHPDFLPQYKDSLKAADVKWIYYNPKAIELKQMSPLRSDFIKQSFNDHSIETFDDITHLIERLEEFNKENAVLLFMSSANFDNLPFERLF